MEMAVGAATVAAMEPAEVAAVVAVVPAEQQRRPRGGRGDGQRGTTCLVFGSTSPRPRICHTPKLWLGKSYFMFSFIFGSTTPFRWTQEPNFSPQWRTSAPDLKTARGDASEPVYADDRRAGKWKRGAREPGWGFCACYV